MPDLSQFHREIVFLHVLGVFLFLLAHGVSAGVLMRLRGERDPGAIRTLLDFSAGSLNVMGFGALVWLVTGILAGFSGGYWTSGQLWIWLSLVIALAVVALMTPLGRFHLNRVRSAVGIDPKAKAGQAVTVDVDPTALDEALRSGRPLTLAALGLGAVVVLTWLMMFKPF